MSLRPLPTAIECFWLSCAPDGPSYTKLFFFFFFFFFSGLCFFGFFFLVWFVSFSLFFFRTPDDSR